MEEIYNHRKTELEVAAKNTIVEIYLIKEKQKEIEKVLNVKIEYLRDVDASLRELEHINIAIKKEEKEKGSKPN